MDIFSTNPPTTPAQPPANGPWLELTGAAALDPVQAERVENWLARMFGDEDDAEECAVH